MSEAQTVSREQKRREHNLAQLINFVHRETEPLVVARNEPAFVLTSWPWKETSLICELLTEHYGRVGVTVRGVKRKGSRFRGIVTPFSALLVDFSGRGELKNMTNARWLGSLAPNSTQSYLTAFYVNELLLRLTVREDPDRALFSAYRQILSEIAKPGACFLARALREFEVDLLRISGWAQSGSDLEYSRFYRVQEGRIIGCDVTTLGPEVAIYGEDVVRAVLERDFRSAEIISEAKSLLKELIDTHVGYRELGARRTLRQWRQF